MLPHIDTQKLTVKAAADLLALRVRVPRLREKTANRASHLPFEMTGPTAPPVAAEPPPVTPPPAVKPTFQTPFRPTTSSAGGAPTTQSTPLSMGNLDPWTAAAITGGLGMGAGLIGSLSDERKRRRWLRNTLLGGVLGAATGGAGASLWNMIGSMGDQNAVEKARAELKRQRAAIEEQAKNDLADRHTFDPVGRLGKALLDKTIKRQIPLTPQQVQLADQANEAPDSPLRQPIEVMSPTPALPLATMGAGAVVGTGLGGSDAVASRLDRMRARYATPQDVVALNHGELKKVNPALAKQLDTVQEIFARNGVPTQVSSPRQPLRFQFPRATTAISPKRPEIWRMLQQATVPTTGWRSSRNLGRLGGGVAGALLPAALDWSLNALFPPR